MSTIQFIQVSPEQLQNEITKGIKAQLDEFLKRFEPSNPERLLTRDDASKLFKVDISTISNWQKNGRLKPFAIGGRIYFKYSDIITSLTPLHEDSNNSSNSNSNESC